MQITCNKPALGQLATVTFKYWHKGARRQSHFTGRITEFVGADNHYTVSLRKWGIINKTFCVDNINTRLSIANTKANKAAWETPEQAAPKVSFIAKNLPPTVYWDEDD